MLDVAANAGHHYDAGHGFKLGWLMPRLLRQIEALFLQSLGYISSHTTFPMRPQTDENPIFQQASEQASHTRPLPRVLYESKGTPQNSLTIEPRLWLDIRLAT